MIGRPLSQLPASERGSPDLMLWSCGYCFKKFVSGIEIQVFFRIVVRRIKGVSCEICI
jgi:hypothetical protein